MLADNGKITMRQLQILIILSAMGTGIIVLPRRVAEYAGQDGWLIVVGLVCVAVLIGLLISASVSAATKHKPGAGFIEFTSHLLTRPVAYVIGIALWLKIVFAAGLELRIFMEITQGIMLPQTPITAVSITLLLVCAYAAAKGMETRARVAEILLGLMILPFLFLVGLSFFNTNFANLQPVLVTPPRDLARGILGLGFIFTGLECLLLVSPFTRKGKKLGRPVAGALAFAGSIIVIITLLTIAKFGQNVVNQPWPVIRMMDMINIPGSFVERQEVLMFSFWIISAFVIVNAMLFFGGLLVKDIFRPKPKHMGVLVTMVAVFAVSVFPWGDTSRIYSVLDFMYMTSGVFFMVVLPLVLLVAAKLRRHVKRGATVAGVLLCLVMFTACWDAVELEDRAFVVAIGIDKHDDEYKISVSVPLNEKDGEENHESMVKTAHAPTITEALKILDAKTDRTLYYGQAKLLILGKDLLTDAAKTNRTISALNNMPKIDARINVLATSGSALEILEAKPPDETVPGLFVADMYRNKNKIGGNSFALDLQRLASSFYNGAIIPMVSLEGEDAIILQGAAVIKDGKKIGSLSREELQGFLWGVSRGNNGAIVTVDIKGVLIPIEIEKHNTQVSFSQNNGLTADITINITAAPQEIEDMDNGLEYELATQIAHNLLAITEKLQHEFQLDGYDWLEVLRQKNYSLYKLYKNDWPYVFPTMEIMPIITVEIV